MDKTDKASLESAIREEAEKAIGAIAEKEAQELKRLDDAHTAALEDFKRRTAARTEARIRHESSKAENRASLDLKKLKLRSVEAFIGRTVEEVAGGIRNDPRYKSFLLAAVKDAVSQISSGAEVRLSEEDLAFEQEIREAATHAGMNRNLNIVADTTIMWGGCIVVDGTGGRIFDNTIERIYYRKSSAIRREVMGLLTGQAAGKA